MAERKQLTGYPGYTVDDEGVVYGQSGKPGGVTQRHLGDRYGVGQSVISRIVNGRSWLSG